MTLTGEARLDPEVEAKSVFAWARHILEETGGPEAVSDTTTVQVARWVGQDGRPWMLSKLADDDAAPISIIRSDWVGDTSAQTVTQVESVGPQTYYESAGYRHDEISFTAGGFIRNVMADELARRSEGVSNELPDSAEPFDLAALGITHAIGQVSLEG